MSENEKPPRLIDDPAFRDALSAVKKEEMPPEQLARNLRSITPTISQPPPSGWLPRGGVGIGVTAIVAALIVGFVASEILHPETGAVATPTPEATPVGGYFPFTPKVTSTPADLTGLMSSPAPKPTPTSTDGEISLSDLGRATPTPDDLSVLAYGGSIPEKHEGTLAEELNLFQAATLLVKNGDYAGALARLDELATRFPATSLRSDAALTRAEALVKARRFDEASALLATLVLDPAHAGRRAELERTFGDVERERGDCTSARTHYRKSLDAGAKGEEASAVRRGLGMCEAQ